MRIYERINECYSICVILYLAVFAIFGFLCVSDDLVLSRCSWIFFWHNLIFFSRLKVICFIYMLIGSVVFEMIGLLYFMTLIRILSDYLFSIFIWPFQIPLFHDPHSNPFRFPFSIFAWPFQIPNFFPIKINHQMTMDAWKFMEKYFLLVFQNIGTLFGPNSMTHPESISINMLNAPGDSTVQCDCGHINCPLCNLMMNLELTDPTRLM